MSLVPGRVSGAIAVALHRGISSALTSWSSHSPQRQIDHVIKIVQIGLCLSNREYNYTFQVIRCLMIHSTYLVYSMVEKEVSLFLKWHLFDLMETLLIS